MTDIQQTLTAINRDIEQLLHGLGQEGLLDDQFAQLMQLQARRYTGSSFSPYALEGLKMRMPA